MDVTFFDSIEDMYDAMDKAKKQADSQTEDWQKQFKPGDYFVKDSGLGFPIFGEVLEEHGDKNLSNYRFCKCYSEACPYGEMGDVHVSTIGKRIDKSVFDRFKEQGWILE